MEFTITNMKDKHLDKNRMELLLPSTYDGLYLSQKAFDRYNALRPDYPLLTRDNCMKHAHVPEFIQLFKDMGKEFSHCNEFGDYYDDLEIYKIPARFKHYWVHGDTCNGSDQVFEIDYERYLFDCTKAIISITYNKSLTDNNKTQQIKNIIEQK